MNRFFLILLSLSLVSASSTFAQDKTYFISSSGNDSNTGLSIKEAWKTISKVNSTDFHPGDKVLFEGGSTFVGNLLIDDSGTPEKPVIYSSFGEGRPIINLGPSEGIAIHILNADCIEISGFEITCGLPPETGVGRNGILIDENEDGRDFHHIVIRDNYIHDIWGQMGGTKLRNAAISGGVVRRRGNSVINPPTLTDVLIEGNRIERFDKVGITTNGISNLKVRRNYMNNIGGDGIFIGGSYRAVVEYNEIHRSCMRSGNLYLPGDTGWENGGSGWWPHTAACWLIRCEESIMQFNEVYDTGREVRNGDGFAYDFDFYCKRCLAQYNYSKENHGFLLIMFDCFENVARYNISENDKTHLVQMQGSLSKDRNLLHNNVFYVDHGILDLDFFRGDNAETAKDINDLGAKFINNIFYATGQGRFRSVYSTGQTWEREFDETSKPELPAGSIFMNNCYFGPWRNGLPDDPAAIVTDPLFTAPGTGGTGLNTLAGYRLKPESPCINQGLYISGNGGRDFFGNPVNDGHIDIGAFEYIGSGAFPDSEKIAQQDKDAADASSVAWARWCFPIELGTENTDIISFRLYEPLENGVSGIVTWTHPDTGKISRFDMAKSKDGKSCTIKVNSDKDTLLRSYLEVSIRKGRFSEEWTIPFSEKPSKRKSL